MKRLYVTHDIVQVLLNYNNPRFETCVSIPHHSLNEYTGLIKACTQPMRDVVTEYHRLS